MYLDRGAEFKPLNDKTLLVINWLLPHNEYIDK